MASGVLIVGPSGSGKSTSIRNLDPKETFIINVLNKDLPFKGWSKNYSEFNKENPKGNILFSNNFTTIANAIKYINESRPEIKNIVIDDFQSTMGLEYARRVKEAGFGKFQDILSGVSAIINAVKDASRKDLIVYLMSHPETEVDANGNKITKAKTVGKGVDQYITIEGMFTIVLYTASRKKDKEVDYFFTTQTDGSNTAKSPMEMFSTYEIPNDLNIVRKAIIEYYS